MSSIASAPAVPSRETATAGKLPRTIGLAGIAVSAAGFAVATKAMAFGWLIAISFWVAVALGMMLFIMLQHVFDAGWGVIVRRQAEHWISCFPYLFLLFLPLVGLTLFYDYGVLWKWMEEANVAADVIYHKKSAYLDVTFFMIRTAVFFGAWIGLAYLLRRNSFNQDQDGELKWTFSNRKVSAAGLFVVGITLSFASIDWMKSLDYHWFSTMYGVWYFATAMRAAISVLMLICLLLVAHGFYQGLFGRAHQHDLGKLMFAFTVFYAYIAFSQYFIIWNANIPEETWWYTLRELNFDGTYNSWMWVGMALVFFHFALPFLFLLHYKTKVNPKTASLAAIWILVFVFVDFCYNIIPAKKLVDAAGNPISAVTGQATTNIFEWTAVPFFSGPLFWAIPAMIGVGGICVWAYLQSFHRQKLIPVRDPRILESVHHHE